MKVALLGSNGAIGQPLSLLLTASRKIDHLSLFDIVDQKGNALDLSHIDSKCKVTAASNVAEGVENADIVVITAGVARKPGMTRDDLLKINAKIVQDLTTNVAQTSPKAMIALVTNPVNMTTVIACETFNKLGLKDTSKIFGVSTLDIMRGSKFVAELNNVDPSMVFCPIIGGHSPDTMVPLYSQAVCSDGQCLTNGELATEEGKNKMTQRIQQAGTAVVEAKKNGSATLSMAYSALRFVNNLISAKLGTFVKEYAYVDLRNHRSDKMDYEYLAVPIKIGENGVDEVFDLENLSPSEKTALKTANETVKKNIETARNFLADSK